MDILALLKAEGDKVARQLEGLNAAVATFAGAYGGKGGRRSIGRTPPSAAARARIAAAQRARWAKIKGEKSGTSATAGARKSKRARTMSAAAKAKIAAAQRARWAKIKRGK